MIPSAQAWFAGGVRVGYDPKALAMVAAEDAPLGIFIRRDNVMLAGSLVSDLSSKDTARRGARVCFLLFPPGVHADAKKTMMERLTADISEAYPGPDDIFIIHREDELANVMLNGRLQLDNPKFREVTPRVRKKCK